MADVVIRPVDHRGGGRRDYCFQLCDPGQHFPKELAGRASGLLNFFHIGAAFVVQTAIGLVLQRFTPEQDVIQKLPIRPRMPSIWRCRSWPRSGLVFPGFSGQSNEILGLLRASAEPAKYDRCR